MKKIFFILLLCIICFSLKAQRLEWANVITGDIGNSFSRGLTIDTDNNSYLLGRIQNTKLNTNLNNLSTIVKYNKDGALLWAKNFSFYISNIIAEKTTCDIYAVVYIDKTEVIGTDTFQQSPIGLNSKFILIKADSSFNIKWAKEIGKLAGTSIYDDIPMRITKDRLVVAVNFNGAFTTPKGNYSSNGGKSTYLLLNFDKTESGSSSEWETTISTKTSNIVSYNTGLAKYKRIDLYDDENTYFIGSSKTIADTLIINNIPYNVKGSYIITLNKNGAVEKLIHIEDLAIGTIKILPSKKIFISGFFYSTFNYKGVSLNTNSLQPTPSAAILMLLNNDGTPIWVKKEENDFKNGLISFFLTEYRNDNIYLGGLVYDGETSLGGFKVGNKSYSNSNTGLLFGKIDTLGNILWIQEGSTDTIVSKSPTFIRELKVDYDGYPIFTGNYRDTLVLLDTSLFGSDGFNTTLFKLNNYSIERGYVYAGPYCAGDTIDIPYTIRGVFEPKNEFIAQLSDENGEFIGGERELGREKSTTDGVVKGTLPLFNVNTSGNYRIRILSTHPPVQSFYKKDTLRLLIYSRDSANAGSDTIVCRGKSVKLSTTGGSKWDWSPAISLNDSALFKPTALPKVDTRYRIIISDSSGCGDTDTDYVWVRLRKPLDIETPFSDSTICKGQSIKLYGNGSGGDSLNYSINWYERTNNGDIPLATNLDSITTSTSSTKVVFSVLNDNCTTLPDTQLYTIKTLAPLKANIVGHSNDTIHLTDTLICFDADLKLYTYNTGGRVSTHIISWYDTGFIAIANAVLVPKAQPQKYYAILKDNCTLLPDTTVIEVMQRQPLSIIIQANDSVCSRNPLQLNATLNGGDSTQYQINWHASNTSWTSNQNPTLHKPIAQTTYIATGSDNCSPNTVDSFAVKVLPIPTPQFTFDNTYGCPPLQVQYVDKSKGNIGTDNRWIIDNGLKTTNANTSKQFNKTALTTAKLITINQFGCSDSITKSEQVNVFQKPQAQFVANPARLEVEEPITFTSTSKEAFKYQWDLGDGILSYNEGTVKRTFYNEGYQTIILVAENSLGCKDTAYKTIRVFEKVYCAIPNAFTPNGDEHNNVFSPACEGILDYTLTIYSRWGQVIHQSRNGAWDGTYADRSAPEGVYMYKIHIHAKSREKSMVYGSVNLIR